MLRSRFTRPRQQRRHPHRRVGDEIAPPAPDGAPEWRERQRELARELERARTAGGPLDEACYSCACGFVFTAAVSTSVACPHCGCQQAW